MTDRPRRTGSLDDLLKANKEQFDKIFSAQMTEIGVVDTTIRPVTREDLRSASMDAAAVAEPVIEAPPPPPPAAVPTTAPEPAPMRAAPEPARRLDTITLDLIENALRNARHEMDAVLFRSAMSPVIREQHDEFPMITDPKGRMIVGQFGSYVNEMLAE